MADQAETIQKLLDQIFVFEFDFKENILSKSKNFNTEKQNKLVEILNHTIIAQEKLLQEVSKKHPQILEELKKKKKEIEAEIIQIYSNLKAKDDSEKVKKMKSIINSI